MTPELTALALAALVQGLQYALFSVTAQAQVGSEYAGGPRDVPKQLSGLAGRAQRACGHYPSPDQAQIDFLASGGPERDKLGLDPDGDGYACAWNPAPFRTAVKS